MWVTSESKFTTGAVGFKSWGRSLGLAGAECENYSRAQSPPFPPLSDAANPWDKFVMQKEWRVEEEIFCRFHLGGDLEDWNELRVKRDAPLIVIQLRYIFVPVALSDWIFGLYGDFRVCAHAWYYSV